MAENSPPDILDHEDYISSPPADSEVGRGESALGAQLVRILLLTLLICFVVLIILGFINEAQKDQSLRVTVVFGVVAFVISLFVLWKLPKQQVSFSKHLTREVAFSLENEARKTLAQIIGGIFLLVGIYSTLKTMQISEVSQLAGRLDKAVEQLSSTKPQVRIFGTTTIIKLSGGSDEYETEVRNVFSAHIRDAAAYDERAQVAATPGPSPAATVSASPTPAPADRNPEKHRQEIQLMLNHLGNPTGVGGGIDLSETDLRGLRFSGCTCRHWDFTRTLLDEAQFYDSNLYLATFTDASLKGANFEDASLREANFGGADLGGANFRTAYAERANFDRAVLAGADFNNADLSYVNFDNADLSRVNFRDADVTGAQFSNAKNLSAAQIESARKFELARLPAGLVAELKAKHPHRPWPSL